MRANIVLLFDILGLVRAFLALYVTLEALFEANILWRVVIRITL